MPISSRIPEGKQIGHGSSMGNGMYESADTTPQEKKSVKASIAVIVFVIIVGILYVIISFLSKKEALQSTAEQVSSDAQTQKVVDTIAAVGKLVVLPEDETPAVFEIKDIDRLVKQQAFFAGAHNGDKLLIYPKKAKAIIFSPNLNRIVNFGPVTFDSAVQAATESQDAQQGADQNVSVNPTPKKL